MAGLIRVELITIVDAIAIGVIIHGVRVSCRTLLISLAGERVAVTVYLVTVGQAIIVGVLIVRICDDMTRLIGIYLVAIDDAVTIGIRVPRIRVAGLSIRIALVALERILRTVNLVTVIDAIAVGVRVIRVGAVFLLLVVGQAILIRISRAVIARLRVVFTVIIRRIVRIRLVVGFRLVVDATAVGIGLVRVGNDCGAGGRVDLVEISEPVTVGIPVRRIRVAWLPLRVSLFVLERVACAVDFFTIGETVIVGIVVVRVGDNAAAFVRVQLITVGDTVIVRVLVYRARVALRTIRIGLPRLIVLRAVDLVAISQTIAIGILVIRVSDNVAGRIRVKLVTIVDAIAIGIRVGRIRVAGRPIWIVFSREPVFRTVDLVTVVDAIAIGIRVVRIRSDFLFLIVCQAIVIIIPAAGVRRRLIVLVLEGPFKVNNEDTCRRVLSVPLPVLLEPFRHDNAEFRRIGRDV